MVSDAEEVAVRLKVNSMNMQRLREESHWPNLHK